MYRCVRVRFRLIQLSVVGRAVGSKLITHKNCTKYVTCCVYLAGQSE